MFLARTKSPDLFLPVEVRKNRPIEPECEIYGYYLRYRQNGRRKVEPMGKDIAAAYAAYRNRELNHTRVRMGSSPSTVRQRSSMTSGRMPTSGFASRTLRRSTSTI